ncbi:hypothetical protein [Cohnella thailandensis]|uniref:Uncharacterized protein n=1 Tax=Cohnella thailandensis TaxID=557557 RepID=A0A841T451_9BACL|nr:hypothetical protein [Cohnella thailandensis]MBB6637616.1 hypothetical protein [Cohnella thailandensis]MBP1974208.1 hypothetical protein [Cohnella thailandensis]
MKNFAEELAYWYLRFNGFFPLPNFVLHQRDLQSHQSADADLLGIRQKYVLEEVGGTHQDSCLFKHFGNELYHIGVICEVKSAGMVRTRDILMAREDRLRYALKRIGFFSESKVEEHLNVLRTEKVTFGRFHAVGKVLFTARPFQLEDWICITLKQAEDFIVNRIRQFPVEKGGAKHFFDSELLQYLIWKNTR